MLAAAVNYAGLIMRGCAGLKHLTSVTDNLLCAMLVIVSCWCHFDFELLQWLNISGCRLRVCVSFRVLPEQK
jgi:hypothetical protein